ncbi:hypothetical protein L798_04482 [Zootermopsis nevadensis]|uniref:Uncharacterized protein n=2 Tax=Zootermopsis nevadensis TaxID=136037 RepID=A0A067QSL5_ZOONE|nr:hypothetical protein L798_04482 [Zootermopsis nevadensis]
MYGSFVDFEFIIYTNASLKGGIEVRNDKNLVSILSSGPNDGKYVTFDKKSGKDVFDFFKELLNYYNFLVQMAAYTDEEIKQEIENKISNFTNGDIKKKLEKLISEPSSDDLGKLIKELEKCDFSLYEEFLQKVKIFQCQANESSFVELIKKELQEACHTSPSGTNSIYENLKQVLENWWKEEGEVDRLSEGSRLWQNIKQLWIEKIKELSKIDVQGSIEFGIRFTEQHMQPLSEALQRSKLLKVITKKKLWHFIQIENISGSQFFSSRKFIIY